MVGTGVAEGPPGVGVGSAVPVLVPVEVTDVVGVIVGVGRFV